VPPKVSIVIINYNGRKYLESFLPSVLASTYENKEVIIADNASTDDSIPFLRSNYPGLRVIPLSRNFGFATGYNEALRLVQSDYYVLLNSDVEVEAGWIEPVIALMENDKKIGACQPKILSYKHKDTFEYAGAAGGWVCGAVAGWAARAPERGVRRGWALVPGPEIGVRQRHVECKSFAFNRAVKAARRVLGKAQRARRGAQKAARTYSTVATPSSQVTLATSTRT